MTVSGQIVKLLVGVYGEDFACPADNGSTPLHWAVSRNMLPVMRLLLGTYCAQVMSSSCSQRVLR